MDKWIGKVIADMHLNKITQIQLADHIGVTNDYISLILLGKRKANANIKERIIVGVKELTAKKK